MPDFQKILGNIADQVGTFLPNVAGALGILIGGWIFAIIISKVIGAAIRKTPLNGYLAGFFPARDGRAADAGRPVGKLVYYLLMLFVLVAFFNALKLPVVSEPLNAFLSQIFEYAPRLFGAGALGLVAWILARVAKLAVGKGLEASDIDNRLLGLSARTQTNRSSLADRADDGIAEFVDDAAEFGDTLTDAQDIPRMRTTASTGATTGSTPGSTASSDNVSLSKTIPDAAYWLVLLLFLPGILGALNMPELLTPIQGMIDKAMGYLPNIIGAGVILAIGWFVAGIVQQIVSNLAASAGANRLAERAGLSTSLSNLLGLVCRALILLPVLVASLNALKIDAVTKPASEMLNQITGLIPGLFGGAVVVGIAYFIANIVSELVRDITEGAGVNTWPAKLGLANNADASSMNLSNVLGTLTKVAIIFVAVVQALPMMGLNGLATQAQSLIGFASEILVGIVILGLGLFLANFVAQSIRGTGIDNAATLANVAKVSIIVLAGAMGIQRMGLAPSIVNLAFGLILGALALAAGISFGWGGRDAAKRVVDRYVS